jgi:hypothetical protein
MRPLKPARDVYRLLDGPADEPAAEPSPTPSPAR